MIQLFACCTEKGAPLPPTCDRCPNTVWSPYLNNNNNPNLNPNTNTEDNNNKEEGLLCGRELGRWATPFKRRGGRWLTDITALLPLLSGGPQCTFTMQSTPWAGTWVPSLTLRLLKNSSQANGKGSSNQGGNLVHKVVPLPFNGGTFDAFYNHQNPPFNFFTPPQVYRALIVSYMTGHGSDEWGCAEFCPTSHTFQINNQQYTTSFDVAGTPWGCADQATQGVLPNEHGTWQYGRNGWCDGQAVQPWVIDITSDLILPANRETDGGIKSKKEGTLVMGAGKERNVITYKGLFQGKDPDSKEPAGEIMMQSTLILYYQAPLYAEV